MIVVAVGEETIFRGYLIQRFHGLTGSAVGAIVISAFVFALGHGYQGSAGVATIGVVGLIFGALYVWRRSLVAPIVMHFLLDFLSVVVVPLSGPQVAVDQEVCAMTVTETVTVTEENQVNIYGALWCPDCQRSKQFLTEQRVPFVWHDVEADAAAGEYVRQVNDGKNFIPTIVFADRSVLVEPTNFQLATKLGLDLEPKQKVYDLIIVGAGPAGLTAGIYAARERMRTLVVERGVVGGQATSTREIENYPGFPTPVGGGELAERLQSQAKRFGVQFLAAQDALKLYREGRAVRRGDASRSSAYSASAAIVATGSTYRKLEVPGRGALRRRRHPLLLDLRRAVLQGPGRLRRRRGQQRLSGGAVPHPLRPKRDHPRARQDAEGQRHLQEKVAEREGCA